MGDTFYTLKAPSEAVYKEKMSKFMAFAVPVTSVTDARLVISKYQKDYFDARHVCWAYMIGAARADFQSNDNGEPSGTAGKPILGQINSFNLTNLVIVVVRYFGGIKLGTSGLITAYKEASREAILAGEIIECHEMSEIHITFPYMSMNDVMRAAKSPGVKIKEQEFDNSCSMVLAIRSDESDLLCARLSDIDGVSLVDVRQTL